MYGIMERFPVVPFPFLYGSLFFFLLASILLLLIHEEARRRILAEREHERRAMLGILSHRLRTPLTEIQWSTEMLLSEQGEILSDMQRKLVHQINDGTCDAVRLLNRFLEVSQAKRGGVVAKPAHIEVGKILTRVIDSLKVTLDERGHTLEVEGTQGEVWAYIDPLLLQAILDALLANAIYYTPPYGKIHVSVRQKRHGVIVSVEDTGIGISEKERSKIFVEFFRGEKARLLHPGGCGLGLSFTKHLLKESGGSLSFTSEEGKGSTFTVAIPRRDERT